MNFFFIPLIFFCFSLSLQAQSNRVHIYNRSNYNVTQGNNYALGNYYLHLGPDYGNYKYEIAIKFYTKALADPANFSNNGSGYQSADVYYKLGYCNHVLHQYADAISNFSTVITLKPNYAPAYTSKGLSEYSEGNYTDALADINKAIQIDSRLADAYYYRSIINYHFQDYKTAIANCDTALIYNPKYVEAIIQRANTKFFVQNFDGAVTDYTHAINFYWENPELYFCRGRAFYNLKNYDAANKDFYKAVTLDGYSQTYKDYLKLTTGAQNTARLAFSANKD